MKKQSLHLIVTAIILGLSAIYITAIPSSDNFRIEIPFGFQVGSSAFEAGTCRFKRATKTQLVFENIETGRKKYVLGVHGANPSGDFTRITLRFQEYGDKSYLRVVSSPGSVFSLVKSKAEKKAARGKYANEVILGN